jgi:hypothetical protein
VAVGRRGKEKRKRKRKRRGAAVVLHVGLRRRRAGGGLLLQPPGLGLLQPPSETESGGSVESLALGFGVSF